MKVKRACDYSCTWYGCPVISRAKPQTQALWCQRKGPHLVCHPWFGQEAASFPCMVHVLLSHNGDWWGWRAGRGGLRARAPALGVCVNGRGPMRPLKYRKCVGGRNWRWVGGGDPEGAFLSLRYWGCFTCLSPFSKDHTGELSTQKLLAVRGEGCREQWPLIEQEEVYTACPALGVSHLLGKWEVEGHVCDCVSLREDGGQMGSRAG